MKNCTSASDLAPRGAVSGSVGRETTPPWGAVLCCEVARGGGSRDGGRESPASECLIVVAGGGGTALGVQGFCVDGLRGGVCVRQMVRARKHPQPASFGDSPNV